MRKQGESGRIGKAKKTVQHHRINEEAIYVSGSILRNLAAAERGINMRRMEFKMEREGLVKPGDEVHISEHKSGLYAYIIEPAVAMSGCYAFRDRILSRTGTVVQVETLESGFMVYVEFEN